MCGVGETEMAEGIGYQEVAEFVVDVWRGDRMGGQQNEAQGDR